MLLVEQADRSSVPRSRDGRNLNLSLADIDVIEKCGLDAYLFLRYLKTLLRIFIPVAIVVLPVLIPINLYGGRGPQNGVGGLDRMSWTNIAPSQTSRYWTHLCLSLLVVAWVCRIFWYELDSYTRLRQNRLLFQAPGTTVLVTDIPEDLISTEGLQRLYSVYPGGVRKVWLQRDYSKLADKVQERDVWALTLEAAETRLIQKALLSHNASRSEARVTTPGQPLWMKHLTHKDREYYTLPTFGISYFPSLPYLGKRVDLIEHCRTRVATLNQMIVEDQKTLEDFKPRNSALIQFSRPVGAHMACRSTQHPSPHVMTSRLVAENANHIIWRNISIGWWQKYIRTCLAGGLIVFLCALCVMPVAFTGLLSQLDYLASIWPWLHWLKKVPMPIQGILQGVLPPALLAAITFLLPIVLERLILEQGVHTDVDAELLLQDYYFGFLFLQVFLVVSISSSVAAVLNGLGQDLESLAALIAQNLPKAGNYFFSYMLLQGLSVSAGTLLQLSRLFSFMISPLWDNTARQKWERQREPVMKWGTFFPVYTNLAAIGLVYSVVSPLILVFNIVTFSLFLVVQQYNILTVSRFDTDTGGLIYPKAIKQLFTGLYVMELYLVGLFFLVRDTQNRPACIGQATIMILVFFLTLVYQLLLTQAYEPLLQSLPVMLNSDTGPENFERCTASGSTSFPLLNEVLDICLGRTDSKAFILSKERQAHATDMDPAKASGVSGELRDQATTAQQPMIWLPRDELGICDDEIERMKKVSSTIRVDNRNANLDSNAKVEIYGPPPSDEDSSRVDGEYF